MFNLLVLFCSFIIQFGAVTFPIDIVSQNAEHEVFAQTVISNFNSTYNKSIDYKRAIITRRNNNTYPYYLWLPIELYDGNVTSSISIQSRNDNYCVISNVGWIRYQVMGNGTVPTSTSPNTNSSIGNLYYSDEVVNNGLIYNGYYTLPIDGVDTFIVEETIDYEDLWGFPFGSLSSDGHTSGGNPLEDLEGFSWDKNTHTFIASGHSTNVSSLAATYDFSNPEQNLLGQIVDNTDDIISNTDNIGGALETINNNIINGVSALFNGISQFNNNFISSYVYDSEKVDETITNSNMFAFANATNDFIYELSDTMAEFAQDVEDQEQIDNLVIPIDLRDYYIRYFDTNGLILLSYQPFPDVYQMRFEFLDETKAIWQPLLLALLYFGLTMSIYFDLPNIIRGSVTS